MKIFLSLITIVLSSLLFAQGVPSVPERTDDNLIVASYNIKWLGQTKHDFKKLAKVISNFDVCGIVEVRKEIAVIELVREIEKLTNKDWGYTFGFRTTNPSGSYYEAYAVVYRRDRVQLGDGLISNVWDKNEAYRNDPYVVSFKSGNFDFALFLLHTRWSDDDDGNRKNEVAELKSQLDFFYSVSKEKDVLLMGDFNYSGNDTPMKEMAAASKLKQCDQNPLTTFKNDYSAYASAYDHLYISTSNTKEYMEGSANAFDVTNYIYGNNSAASMKKSKSELSDHLPIFGVYKTNGKDDD
ncbi:MAG: endonuclease/exonuclease/phosphatase family protein [Crocinitomicaceae bacterium]|nr:endonuclease/exonuclease/phosphatase family protein [Crocinitomicaceae bacterium]